MRIIHGPDTQCLVLYRVNDALPLVHKGILVLVIFQNPSLQI